MVWIQNGMLVRVRVGVKVRIRVGIGVTLWKGSGFRWPLLGSHCIFSLDGYLRPLDGILSPLKKIRSLGSFQPQTRGDFRCPRLILRHLVSGKIDHWQQFHGTVGLILFTGVRQALRKNVRRCQSVKNQGL